MRAGGFAETRVIDLINRRYVPYYYEVSGMGCAASPDAAAFVAKQTRNPYAFLAAFTPEGELVGETALYADKDQVFEFLRSLLVRHPDYAEPTPAEEQVLAALAKPDADAAACCAGAELLVELGAYASATRAFERALAAKPGAALAVRAELALTRIAREQREWDEAKRHTDRAAALVPKPSLGASDLIALERGRYDLAHGEYARARDGLQAAIAAWPGSRALGELHFDAGVACFFAGERDLAKYHWCWVCENIPEDRLYQRCYYSATFDKNPYPNPELGRNDMDVVLNPGGKYSPTTTSAAYAESKKVYERLRNPR